IIEADGLNTTIRWNTTEENKYRYYILVDNETVVSSEWDSDEIMFPLNAIFSLLGSHNVTLLVVDYNLNTATDTVMVDVVDTISPVIDSPPSMEIIRGDWNARITWTITEALPHRYNVTRDSTIIMSGSLLTNQVIVNLQTLAEGVYTFTLTVVDTSGNVASDTVIVTVVEPTTTTTSLIPPDDPGWSELPTVDIGTIMLLGFGFVIIAVGCMILRSSKTESIGSSYQYY
ncbi:MAG: hypothetical protein P1Q69_20210, partial [Candidatus Thorarchaeota archaeon]|nr:hypothetical protein [Candidatus Thorarchaeota archaeon]